MEILDLKALRRKEKVKRKLHPPPKCHSFLDKTLLPFNITTISAKDFRAH